MKNNWLNACLILLLFASFNFQSVQAEAGTEHTYVPIGSGYSSATLQLFARQAVQHDTDGTVEILVIPITYATNAYNISNGERQKNLDLANNRRGQIETACNAVKLANQTCHAVLAPVLVRDDAFLPENLALFPSELDGMFILGGDQTIAMQVVANTPFEASMAAAFNAGAVVSGNSAGAAVQSINMIGGYTGNNGPENGFQQGSVDLWLPGGSDPDRRGLSFGMTTAVLDQHEFQRGRIARLINTSFTTGLLGIGMDADTGAVITNEDTLTDVTGATATIIIDLQTYNASGHFAGPTDSLAVHGLTTHLIPPGGFGYDLTHRRPLVDGHPLPAPLIAGRSFDVLHLPSATYGSLILAGDLRSDLSGSVTQRFVALSGGTGNASLVVLALGYAKNADAQADAKAYATALQSQVTNPVQWFVVDSRVNQTALQNAINEATGILVTSPDQSRVMNAFASISPSLRNAWAGGKVILADNAAAAALGQAVSTDATPTSSGLESASMGDFLFNGVTIEEEGLNWNPGVAVEPRMVVDRHWGRLYNHLYRNHALLGLGVDVNTAIEFTPTGANVWGLNTVSVFDGRFATYGLGTNNALSERFVLLDTYVDGDMLVP
jgi:cyanophycinase